ncbi:Fcf2 domain containing protein [Amanita muscaria]
MSPLSAKSKGKQKASEDELKEEDEFSSSESSSSYSDSDSDPSLTSGDESSDDDVGKKLESSLKKAIKDAAREKTANGVDKTESDIIILDKKLPPLPRLDPGISSTYLQLDGKRVKLRDPDVDKAEKAASCSAPAPPLPPAELNKDGAPLTKKQKKELRRKTAGPDWFDLPAPPESELPRLYREVEALRLRNQLDPKRFYRKDEGEGRGIKGLPQYFAIGTVLPTETPFGTPSIDNIPKSHRKRTIVDELVDDAEAKSYAKKKFKNLQGVREAKGKNTLAAKKMLRKPKW